MWVHQRLLLLLAEGAPSPWRQACPGARAALAPEPPRRGARAAACTPAPSPPPPPPPLQTAAGGCTSGATARPARPGRLHQPDGAPRCCRQRPAGWPQRGTAQPARSLRACREHPLAPSGQDEQGLFWDIQLWEDASNVGLLIHRGEEKAAGATLPGAATGEVRGGGRHAAGARAAAAAPGCRPRRAACGAGPPPALGRRGAAGLSRLRAGCGSGPPPPRRCPRCGWWPTSSAPSGALQIGQMCPSARSTRAPPPGAVLQLQLQLALLQPPPRLLPRPPPAGPPPPLAEPLWTPRTPASALRHAPAALLHASQPQPAPAAPAPRLRPSPLARPARRTSADTLVWRVPAQDAAGPRRFFLHCSARAIMWTNAQGVQAEDLETIPLEVRAPWGWWACCRPAAAGPGWGPAQALLRPLGRLQRNLCRYTSPGPLAAPSPHTPCTHPPTPCTPTTPPPGGGPHGRHPPGRHVKVALPVWRHHAQAAARRAGAHPAAAHRAAVGVGAGRGRVHPGRDGCAAAGRARLLGGLVPPLCWGAAGGSERPPAPVHRCRCAASQLSRPLQPTGSLTAPPRPPARPLPPAGVQLHGVLDDLFYYSGPLGDQYDPARGQHVISV
jgi:hypothetical protein